MFAKVFTQILDSSLAEDYQVRLVFEDLLKLAGKDGVVDMTRESISRRTNVPLEIVAKGLGALEMPDTSSRTPDMGGRRIVRLDDHRDWGWRIVNFEKYRESATVEMLRMAERERKAEYRRRKGFPSHFPSQREQSTEREREAEQSTDMSGTICKKPSKFVIPSIEEVKLQAAKIGLSEVEAEKFVAFYESNGWKVGKNKMESWRGSLSGWKLRSVTPGNAVVTERVRLPDKKRALEELLSAHPCNRESIKHTGIETEDEWKEYRALKNELSQVRLQLAGIPANAPKCPTTDFNSPTQTEIPLQPSQGNL